MYYEYVILIWTEKRSKRAKEQKLMKDNYATIYLIDTEDIVSMEIFLLTTSIN